MTQRTKTVSLEPLLLLWPTRNYQPGDFITVDRKPAVIRKVISNSGTALRAEIEIYESPLERAKANPRQLPKGTLAEELDQFRQAWVALGYELIEHVGEPILRATRVNRLIDWWVRRRLR